MSRILQLIEKLKLKDNEALVLHSEPNKYYLSGYNGEGLVVVSSRIKAIITDFRYTEQAEAQASDFEILMIGNGKSHNVLLQSLLAKHQVISVYAELDFISHLSYEALTECLQGISIQDLGNALTQLRAIKDETELSYLKKACQITVDSFKDILPYIKEGVSERELAARLEFIMKSRGGEGIAFDTICAAGANGSLPHAVPGDYKVQSHDMITFDFGAKYKGYCADMTRTVSLGTPSDTMANVYNVVMEAQALARKALKPGVVCKDVDAVARDYIHAHGFEGRFGHGLGHAVGIEVHENPRLSGFCDDIVQVNHVLTVEPGIYLPGIGGVRIEDSCIITQDGNVPMTDISRELIIL